ncbi:PAS domain S-box protein [Edaphosphingomonas haloaromaticamans]|uniref:histidine kinase n=1 Tax=Edaphosphingomonas haloaromaticamans TaxID=653954 RepID=A0A1S1HEM4_9SPHN|nr:PAS domain S-box protein [Sphingomonas haloaromaticamans]OHT19663.1 Blue-light-activated histidine kinase 1 [Sphingomonas haloaromaticamans]
MMGSDSRAIRLVTASDAAARTDNQPPDADATAWLGAIIDSSFDAILSKTLDGLITSWNGGAEKLFGYTRAEAIGQPITMLIPEDRLHEEIDIIARLRRGERIDRLETVRLAKGGIPVEIEVTISPVRDAQGRIIGASKIAHDISERRRQAEAQQMILREMHHRIKNLLTIVQGLVSVSRRSASTVDAFADDLGDRLAALGAVHRLILTEPGLETDESAALDAVLHAVLHPYLEGGRITIEAPPVDIGRHALTSMGLLLHELATNAVKYGGLSNARGTLDIKAELDGDDLLLMWREHGGQKPSEERHGFGTDLMAAALKGLGGTMERAWLADGLELALRLPRDRLGR